VPAFSAPKIGNLISLRNTGKQEKTCFNKL